MTETHRLARSIVDRVVRDHVGGIGEGVCSCGAHLGDLAWSEHLLDALTDAGRQVTDDGQVSTTVLATAIHELEHRALVRTSGAR